MRLLQRSARIQLAVTAGLLLVAGIGLYLLLTRIQRQEVSEKLLVNLERVMDRIMQGGSVPQLPPILEVEAISSRPLAPPLLKDTTLYDPQEGEVEPFREAIGVLYYKDTTYRVTVRQVVLEAHDVLGPIGVSLTAVMLVLLIALVTINHRINARLWAPFQRSLGAMKDFRVDSADQLELLASGTTEFNELNAVVAELTERVRIDYRTLRDFTANAAHEMRTPVATVLNTLEQALQSPDLTGKLAADIGAARSAALRLSKLHAALLVLARIENRQYQEVSATDLRPVVSEQLEQLEELIAQRGLTVRFEREGPPCTVMADPALISMLVANLVGNAIKHNIPGGRIEFDLGPRSFTIANTGAPLPIAASLLLDRFAKADPSSASLGLGLAIVRAIRDHHHWTLSYTSNGPDHMIRIVF